MFSDSNGALEGQGGQPPAMGWFTLSKVPKITEFCFDYESTKKKPFEKSQMCANS
jgi:hypothetical protein